VNRPLADDLKPWISSSYQLFFKIFSAFSGPTLLKTAHTVVGQ